jgi:disulfide bond formation protein DsbB
LIRARRQRRWLNLAGFGAVVGLISYALFAQYVQGYEACPLCILQRVVIIGLGLVLLAAGLHAPRGAGARAYGVLGLAVAAIGVYVAGRHVYIQSLPEGEVPPPCGAGLDYMLDVFGPFEAVRMVLTSAGECADVNWVFLGLSMPAWVLLWFVALGGLAITVNWPRLTS